MKNIPILIFLLLLIIQTHSKYTQEIFDCITKSKCKDQYLNCGENQECIDLMNKQAACRYNHNCNQVLDSIWDPVCFWKCQQNSTISTQTNLQYDLLTKCATKACKAFGNQLNFIIPILVILAVIVCV